MSFVVIISDIGIGRYESSRHYLETFFTLLAFGAHLTEEHMERINEDYYSYLKDCLTAFEEIKGMPHLGKIMRGYGERNFEVISNYIDKGDENRESNIKQLIQELQNIKRSCGSNRNKSFISETLLDIIKYMVGKYMSQTQFKIGALSGLICEAIHSELKKEVSLEDMVSPKVASMLSDQDAINLSLVCESINCKS
ncbi:MAG: hypothetical protein U0X86_000878 [Wolbachia endosymbiont of Xenopsylla cheopis]